MNNRNNNPRGRGRGNRRRRRHEHPSPQRGAPEEYENQQVFQEYPQDPQEQAMNRQQIHEHNVRYATGVLDRIPHRAWGTWQERQTAKNRFNEWRVQDMEAHEWLVHNIVLMDEFTFERRHAMNGIYRFCAYVRMYNFVRLTEEEKYECMELGDLPRPPIPEVADLRWFLEPRTENPYFEVNEQWARLYLDQPTIICSNVTLRLQESLFRHDHRALIWVAANIRCMDSENIWMRVPTYWPVAQRSQNWLNMHKSWREEFMSVAYVSFDREAVRFDPNHPETLDCLRDAPRFNRNLRLTDQLANDSLNRISNFRFCNRQIFKLYDIWRRKNPKYRRLLRNHVAQGDNEEHNRMLNWLTMDVGWKEILYRHVWRERV